MNDNEIETDAVRRQLGTIVTGTYVRTGKPGHPSKYTPTAVRRLLAAIADGMTNKAACIAANIGVATLRDWRKEHPDLEVRMEEARERARQKALAAIKAAGQAADWRAWAEWLRFSYPEDYRKQPRPTTQNTLQINQQVVLPSEEQQKLIEQRRRLLAAEGSWGHEQLIREGLIASGPAGDLPAQEAEIVAEKPTEPEEPAASPVGQPVEEPKPELEPEQPRRPRPLGSLYNWWSTARVNQQDDAEQSGDSTKGGPPRLL